MMGRDGVLENQEDLGARSLAFSMDSVKEDMERDPVQRKSSIVRGCAIVEGSSGLHSFTAARKVTLHEGLNWAPLEYVQPPPPLWRFPSASLIWFLHTPYHHLICSIFKFFICLSFPVRI